MNNMVEAGRQQVRGLTRKWWDMLSDDNLKKIGAKAERLAERYGYIRQHAELQSNRWMHDRQVAPAVEL